MIIVAGQLHVRPGARADFLARSAAAMREARGTPGCHDFVVAADPLEPERVNVFEAWTDRAALEAFRGSGPGDDLSALIGRATVAEYDVAVPDR